LKQTKIPLLNNKLESYKHTMADPGKGEKQPIKPQGEPSTTKKAIEVHFAVPFPVEKNVRQTSACLVDTDSKRDDRAQLPSLAKRVHEMSQSHGKKCFKIFMRLNKPMDTEGSLYADLATCFRSLLPLGDQMYSIALIVSVNYGDTSDIRSLIAGEVSGMFQGLASAKGWMTMVTRDTHQIFGEGSDFTYFHFIQDPWHDCDAPVWP
jgi:hypothetical protein